MALNYKLLGALSATNSGLKELENIETRAGYDFMSVARGKGPAFHGNVLNYLKEMKLVVNALVQTLDIAIDECEKEIKGE